MRHRARTDRLLILLLLAVLAVLSVSFASLCGSTGCDGWRDAEPALWQWRGPRALAAFVVGGLLALAGALMQLLLRNPLADPYVLGVSGGAAAGALGASLWAPGMLLAMAVPAGALTGALLSTLLLFWLARPALSGPVGTSGENATGARLILTGVMIAAGFGALITFLLSVSPDAQLRGAIFWLMGDLDTTELSGYAAALLLLALWWSARTAASLNVLAHGEATAQLLGLPVRRLRVVTLLIASLCTAAAVAVAGAVGFIGLVVPHAVRLVLGNDQRLLLPASALAGGAALSLADLAARSLLAPTQLPVGVVTALVGVPVFLWLLGRGR